MLKDKSEIEKQDIAFTGFIVEIATAIISFFSSFFLIGGAVSIVTNLIITNIVEFLILYLRYYEKDKISEGKVFLLFIITFPLAYLGSIAFTSIIFALFGIKDTYFLINF